MLEYSREALAEFFRVEARTSNGSITSFYGGDQSWFESENGRAGGCGTVAAANILAYFGVVLGVDGAFGGSGPVLDSRHLKQADYLAHMHQVYAGLTPLVPPWKSMTRFQRGRGDVGGQGGRRSILKLPDSLGIHSPARFANAVVELAQKQDVELRRVWPLSGTVRWSAGQSVSLNQAKAFILGQVEKGFPVAMLNFNNRGLRQVDYQSVVSGRTFTTDRFQWHWVVVTGVETDERTGRDAIIVSSWGNRAALDLDRFWGRGLSYLVSFEVRSR